MIDHDRPLEIFHPWQSEMFSGSRTWRRPLRARATRIRTPSRKGCGALAALKSRFPSARDTARVFALCVVPIYSWSILLYLSRVPGWLYYESVWDVIGILAYSLVFAALESGALLLVPLLLSVILPKTIMRDRFAVYGSAFALLILGCALFGQALIVPFHNALTQRYPQARILGRLAFLPALVIFCVLPWRNERLAKAIASVAERMVPLMKDFMLATLVAAVIVVIRNL